MRISIEEEDAPSRSITSWLTLMFASATLLIFIALSLVLYNVLQREMLQHQKDELSTVVRDVQYAIEQTGNLSQWREVRSRMEMLRLHDGRAKFWLLSSDPEYVYNPGDVDSNFLQHMPEGHSRIKLPDTRQPFAVLKKEIAPLRDRPQVELIVALDTTKYADTLRGFLLALVALSLVAVVLISLLGYWISRMGLWPLHELSEKARALSPKTLSQRLPAERLADELSGLVCSFNGALNRLETAYNQLERFNADVANELRNPLSRLIKQTQQALSGPATVVGFHEVLESHQGELERLNSIIKDMVFLAQADQGQTSLKQVHALLAHEVRKVLDELEHALRRTSITVKIEGDVGVQAPVDTALFRHAMTNLLQNAIEHSARDAQVCVCIDAHPTKVKVCVMHPSEPIDSRNVVRLFDHFYCSDEARRHEEHHGYGLGLTLVKSIVQLHGGEVFSTYKNGVTTVGFDIPLKSTFTVPEK